MLYSVCWQDVVLRTECLVSCLYSKVLIPSFLQSTHPTSACGTDNHTAVWDDQWVSNSFKFAPAVNRAQDVQVHRVCNQGEFWSALNFPLPATFSPHMKTKIFQLQIINPHVWTKQYKHIDLFILTCAPTHFPSPLENYILFRFMLSFSLDISTVFNFWRFNLSHFLILVDWSFPRAVCAGVCD